MATAVSACSTHAPAAVEPVRTQSWQCEQSGYVVSSPARDSDRVWLFLPGQTVQLEPAGPDSYAADDIRLTINGIQSELVLANNREACVEDRRQSIREDAKLRGVDFWATGNEPPWRLEMGPELFLLKTGYANERHEFPSVDAQSSPAARQSVWVTSSDMESLTIELDGRECIDSMSGEAFATSVKLLLNGRELYGCGTALH